MQIDEYRARRRLLALPTLRSLVRLGRNTFGKASIPGIHIVGQERALVPALEQPRIGRVVFGVRGAPYGEGVCPLRGIGSMVSLPEIELPLSITAATRAPMTSHRLSVRSCAD